MASDIPVTVQWGNLAAGYAPADWQDLINQLEKIVTAYLPGSYKPVNFGNSTPSAEDQDRPWVRTNVDGSPDRTYIYFNGAWVAKNPIGNSASDDSYIRQVWVGTEEQLRSYDGGDGTTDTPTDTVGAMWEVDTTFQDKIPMGVLAATGQATTPLATAGALTDSITLTTSNLPRHRHEVSIQDGEGDGEAEGTGDLFDADAIGGFNPDGADLDWNSGAATGEVGYTRYYGKATPDAIEIDTVPPVVGVHIIKRTARVYYTVS